MKREDCWKLIDELRENPDIRIDSVSEWDGLNQFNICMTIRRTK